MQYIQMNATEARRQLAVLADACNIICRSSFDACLDKTEPSFENEISACNDYVGQCLSACTRMRWSYLPTNFPVNIKFNTTAASLTFFVFLPFLMMLALASLSCIFPKDSNETPRRIPTAIGITIGIIAGVFASIGIRSALLPKLENFSQNNPIDERSADYITATLGIVLTTACIVSGAIGMRLLDAKAKSCILHAYERGLCNRKKETLATTELNTTTTNRQQLQMV